MDVEDRKRLGDCMELLHSYNTLQLATVDANGLPHISYAPFIRQDTNFFIFVSQLAGHTQRLKESTNASVMVIKDEAGSRNLFARERFVADVVASTVEPAEIKSILDAMEITLGNTVALLRSLPDFILFRLTVTKAKYIAGFGKAYQVDLCRHTVAHISAESLAKP
ncbi:pyridoxamine 5'-phosphate oxidase family protein [Neptunomonas sp.]|uniref:HugZ family pyridoxamine 5'-phosphate oxidase n=1 Tax=Neptunomonas sp. TaxID=1971898 RepID=UPI0025EFB5AE|nr:pyridoxamine 5'-phosphate oxidase family protein [Neptunomonas sp.]